ncbi:MAG: hypothetical protein RRY07_10645 [Bacteroidaceae bacterium]
MEFRAILWGRSSKSFLYCNLSGSTYSFTTCNIQREQFTSHTVEFSNIKKIDPTFSTNGYNVYYFLDDIIVYKKNATSTEQKEAHKIILTGHFTTEEVGVLNSNLSANTKITNINALSAIFPENTKLTPGNKNCLIQANASSNVSNTENLILENQCQKLCLYEGFNFHSDCDFTATTISYDRIFKLGDTNPYYSTVCLPFTIQKSNVPNINYIGSLSSLWENIITFKSVNQITANEPCIIKCSSESPFLNLTDVNVNVKASTGCKKTFSAIQADKTNAITITGLYSNYVGVIKNETTTNLTNYAFGYSNGALHSLGNGNKVKPFRAVINIENTQFTSTNGVKVAFNVEEEDINEIESIKVDKSNERVNVYTLQGVCLRKNIPTKEALDGLPKGCYLINKKKAIK